MFILYLAVALFATFIGSMTGMGGGLIMKPVMDALGHFPTPDINVLSSVSVFAMSALSCAKRLWGKKKQELSFSLWHLITLCLFSVCGGYIGQLLFSLAEDLFPRLKSLQNLLMLILVAFIFFYMLFKDKLPRLHLKGFVPFALAGLFMGMLSSFLGIGGGPVNVALLTFCFSMAIKEAVFVSLLSVLFTQGSKLLTVALSTGFGGFDLSMLPFTVVGALVGASLGSSLAKGLSQRATSLLFCSVQVLIFLICLYNVFF